MLSGENDFIGFEGYRALASDPIWATSFYNSILYAGGVLAGSFGVGLALALLLNESLRFRNLMRGLFMIPWIMPSAVAALLWRWMFGWGEYSVVNYFLYHLGLISTQELGWYAFGWSAMLALIMLGIWKTFPYALIILLAGLQSVPSDLYESAKVDGATKWSTFRHITFPNMSFPIALALLGTFISSFTMFDYSILVTNGGPSYATLTLSFYTYIKAIGGMLFGYGSDIAVSMVIVLIIFVVLYIKTIMGRRV